MTITINNSVGQVSINDAETRFIAKTGIAQALTAINFTGVFEGTAIVAGSAVGSSSGAALNGDDYLAITPTGDVLAVDSPGGDAIRASGNGNEVSVAGLVLAEDTGIFSFNNDDFLLTIAQTGMIQAGSNGRGVDSGAFSAAVAINGSSATIFNDGSIIGEFNPDNGQRIAVLNAGVADANPNGFDIGLDSDVSFFNSGHVIGDVLLGAGEDLYNGRGGLVNGTLDLGAGDDTFIGGDEGENASGGADDDFMSGGGGMDTLNGAHGADIIQGDDGSDFLTGASGLDTIFGGMDDDTIVGGTQSDQLRGNTGNDDISGNNGNDNLFGGAGDDEMSGGTNNDLMGGGRGDDNMQGNGGSDTLNGGLENDTLEGGGGSDLYVFDRNFGNDDIIGFVDSNREKIDLSGLSQIVNFNDLSNNHLSQDGSNAVITVGDNTITLVNFNANALDAGDFVF